MIDRNPLVELRTAPRSRDRKARGAMRTNARRWGCLAILLSVALLLAISLALRWQGATTQITIVNESGHAVRIDLVQFADWPVSLSGPLQSYREKGGNQKSVHYQSIYFQRIKPKDIPVRIRYTELDTGVNHQASFVVDRRPHARCRFVVVLSSEGPKISECQPSELDDFD